MFKIGDTVYVARYGRESVTLPCPICFGKLKVELILGNGDSVVLPCDYCGKGHFGIPQGVVTEYEFVAKAERVIISGIESEQTTTETKTRYRHSGCYIIDQKDVFTTNAEALVAAGAEKEKTEQEERTRIEYLKNNVKKTFAWNAGYHMREAKRNRDEAEAHEQKAVLCKDRAKKEKPA